MTFSPPNFTVWAEVPVSDLEKAVAFYNHVFNLDLQIVEIGPNPSAFFPSENDGSVSGHLYPGKPAADGSGPTVHFACPDTLEETMARVTAAGGTVTHEPIPIEFGRFFYFLDPDGNSLGVFQFHAQEQSGA
ncbi:MAG: VOC family protein [Alphaproteobacteria bacterium]|nr:VOC family protein [Alphaproteobacteria bacterium]